MINIYHVKVSNFVMKYVSKLGSKDRDFFNDRFNKLKYDKSGYKLLDVINKVELWELRCSSHRVYYTVENTFIVIDNIEYSGDIEVINAGNKNQQRRDIDYSKNRLRHK